ncbi:MAG: phosphonopyruvate decarboxylase [Rhodospirillaceae bacterium]|nr:phosphonopyruvate decarboxylase [Rhodospirillaceae bacterium]
MKAEAVTGALQAHGFNFFTGVPCSFLTPLINRTITDPELQYVGAASEGEAVAIASGAWLAGKKTVIMCQNSGLGNTVNPLTSLNHPFAIPTLLLVTWRGEPGIKDEPQHVVMGRISQGLLSLMRFAHKDFPETLDGLNDALEKANKLMEEEQLPFGFILRNGLIEDEPLDQAVRMPLPLGNRFDLVSGGERPTRYGILEKFLEIVPEQAAVVATTGKCGRELFTLDDRKQHIYQVGSMGCAAPMALGVALNNNKPVVALDGDGAALMKLGAWATIGAEQPNNFIQILLDNEVHDSTGGQATVSPMIDFCGVAIACGYRNAWRCDSLDGFSESLQAAVGSAGPNLIHTQIQPGSLATLGRPTVTPQEVARRFKDFLSDGE